MLEKVKKLIGIEGEDYDSEITLLLSSATIYLKNVGITDIEETSEQYDQYVLTVAMYVKAHFDGNGEGIIGNTTSFQMHLEQLKWVLYREK